MKQETLLQADAKTKGGRVIDLASRLVAETRPIECGAAVAYASVSGLRSLLALIPAGAASDWLIGLDDCLSHPSVLEVLQDLRGARLRVAGEVTGGSRFHPKVFWFLNRKSSLASMVVGSANLTYSGLHDNVESVVAMTAGKSSEVTQLERHWINVWQTGVEPTKNLLADYRKDFARAVKQRAQVPKVKGPVLARDQALLDPSRASVVWIEVGNITGFKQEQLEIKAEQALFFGLPIHGGADSIVTVDTAYSGKVEIPVKYRGNAMWRFNLPDSIREVGEGLRPNGKRSPFLAVFTRRPTGDLIFEFVKIGSRRSKQLVRESARWGTLGHTTARDYGWY
jgi:hypothetical protein